MSHSESHPSPAWRSLVALACALLLGRTALAVEDGQFEREYSRLYTMPRARDRRASPACPGNRLGWHAARAGAARLIVHITPARRSKDGSPIRMAARIAGYGPSVFAEMTALARESEAVNLGQGLPDFDGPDPIKEAAQAAIAAGHNQYAVSAGEPVLRAAIAKHALRFYGQHVDPATEITVTSGASEGIWCACLCFHRAGG